MSNLTPHSFDAFLSRNNRAMKKGAKTRRTPFTLRLPPALHEEVMNAAALAGHSMTEEITLRLQEHAQALTLSQIAQQNAELKRMVQQLIDRQS